MRGKPPTFPNKHFRHRITPADAGKTYLTASLVPSSRDHPRGCGENERAAERRQGHTGSPPRMRGKLSVKPEKAVSRGITPADAGKTFRQFLSAIRPTDHPRGCGENLLPKPLRLISTGSPPRMRGKPTNKINNIVFHGITPADAGKTFPYRPLYGSITHHPRGCGENIRTLPSNASSKGSPPRMRGKPHTRHAA